MEEHWLREIKIPQGKFAAKPHLSQLYPYSITQEAFKINS